MKRALTAIARTLRNNPTEAEKFLWIEVDGGQHARCPEDEVRDQWLKGQGFEVIRFWNHDVLKNREGVLEKIAEQLKCSPSLTLPQRGREAKFER